MTIEIDNNNINYETTSVANSNYTTSDDEILEVDTSTSALTITLATADTTAGQHIRAFDVGGNIETNAVTIDTEGSENVDGGNSVTWDHNNGSYVDLWSDGSNWFTTLQQAADVTATDEGTITSSDKDIPGVPASSSTVSPGFGSWTQASSDRPAELLVEAEAQTDGTDFGVVDLEVDESGGTTADYTVKVVQADRNLSDGHIARTAISFELPAGAQYQIVNASDPNAANQIRLVREMIK